MRVTERDREGEEEGERDLVRDTELVGVDTRVVGRPELDGVKGKVVATGERERDLVTEGERVGLRDTVGEWVRVDRSVLRVMLGVRVPVERSVIRDLVTLTLLVLVTDTLLHEDTQKVGLLLLVGDTVELLVCASTSVRKEEEESSSSGAQKMVEEEEESRPGS